MTGSSSKKDGFDHTDAAAAGEAVPADLRERQSDFFEEYFKKGAEFTRALIAENESLRRELRARTADPSAQGERDDAGSGPVRVGAAHDQIEREHYDLACLFVAQGQLTRAEKTSDVLGVIAEILLNFVGAHCFAIYAADSAGVLRPLFGAELELGDLPIEAPARLRLAFENNEMVGGAAPASNANDVVNGEPVAAFPLRCDGKPFGAVAIWSFLNQKTQQPTDGSSATLLPIDRRLFEVIGSTGGAALETSRIRGQLPRLAQPPDHYSGLALLLGLGGRGGQHRD